LSDNHIENGYERELNIDVPMSVKPYVSAVYGIEKKLNDLLSFKVGTVCKEQLMDYVEQAIYYALLAGMQQQKEINTGIMMDMQRQLDILIKRDGQAAKERKEKVGC
jgi:hypothetical protein